jgi:5-methylcytosine-specific restriction enzyme B
VNLAHVEHYFADVLSAMESGHPIPLHRSDEVVREQGVPKDLMWPLNLFVVGTVNADETTYPFSPKVPDRAFVIDVSAVDLDSYVAMVVGNDAGRPPLPAFSSRRDWRQLDVRTGDAAFVRQLHDVLRDADRPFGYRTIDESLAFLAHAHHFEGAGLLGRDALLASKILPRLHGRRHELERALDGLLDWLGAAPEATEGDDSVEQAFPQTLKALRRMHRQLEDEGHVASMIG